MTDKEPRWTPENVGKWKRHFADFLAYLLAAFLVLFASINAAELGAAIVGSMFALAAGLLGVPFALWLDRSGRNSDE